jgi:MoxR-like ATPase
MEHTILPPMGVLTDAADRLRAALPASLVAVPPEGLAPAALRAVAGTLLSLREDDALPAGAHLLSRDEVDALRAALAMGRPLLVRGEPGAGKTQLARAAAVALGRALVTQVVDEATEVRDLCYRVDLVRRLADAQLQGRGGEGPPGADNPRDIARYVERGALWWGLRWAAESAAQAHAGAPAVTAPASGLCARHYATSAQNGVVVLLDEVDKAERGVLNGLLEVLGEGRFTGPDGVTVRAEGDRRPLVLLTTNEERPLPDPLLRRCLVLRVELPPAKAFAIDDAEAIAADPLVGYLWQRSAWLPGAEAAPAVVVGAAVLIARARAVAAPGAYRPGLAEHVDLVRAALELGGGDAVAALEALGAVAPFALDKGDAADPEAGSSGGGA